ncbi:MAG: hypothetical protein HPY85_02375 [Anaerolineae bacterium]|nr:hypothetical protein [Anaerolineae bacterium]
MYLKKSSRRIRTLCSAMLLLAILLGGCNLPGGNSKTPATPTVAIQIPLVTVALDDSGTEPEEETAEEAVVPTETPVEEAQTEETEVEAEEPTTEAEDQIEPTATIAPDEALETPMPTRIPPNASSNPDATVYFTGNTNCHVNDDTESAISAVVIAGNALGAVDRNWNFYQVHHPTRPGLFCWVTGPGISPNSAAYHLGD